MPIRGVRGATIAKKNAKAEILAATRELLEKMIDSNPGMAPEDLASVLFTVTEDINAVFPAQAAREIGWSQVPLICAREIPVPDGIEMCIRVLIHWNTERSQTEIKHIYLGESSNLRPDLSSG
jgi:chorismate mutase